MTENPLISVLMTAFNRENYIGEAIESVLSSTYKKFELIIVDDCSQDKTVDIIKKYAGGDSRIRWYVNEKNIGQFQNRNLVASYAKGKYLKYLDSDDLIYPTGLQVLVMMMEQFPDAGYGLCSLAQEGSDGKIYPFALSPAQAYDRHFCKKIAIFHKAPLSSVFRKDVFEQVGGFKNEHGEGDYEMWLLLSATYNVVLMPDGVVWYRIHEEQIDAFRRSDPYLRFRYFLVTLKYMNENCPLDNMHIKQIRKETEATMAKFICISFYKYGPKKALQMYQAADFSIGTFLKALLSGKR